MPPVLTTPWRTLCGLIALGLVGVAIGADMNDAADAPKWAAGAALRRQLVEPVDLLWSANPLRQAVTGLSRSLRVAVLIDRRVDPGQRVDLAFQGEPLGAVFEAIARHCGLGVSRLDNVVYLGPPAAAERLRGVATQWAAALRPLAPDRRAAFFRRKKLAWPDFSTPRDLLLQLGREGGLTLLNPERIPHDLWAAADLPPLSLADRLTLVAVQFDLTFRVTADGRRIELVPIPKDGAETRRDTLGLNVSALPRTAQNAGRDAKTPSRTTKPPQRENWNRPG